MIIKTDLKKKLEEVVGKEFNETLVNSVKNIVEKVLRRVEKEHKLLILNKFSVEVEGLESLNIVMVPKRIVKI
jgi:hypothetical protein